MTNYHKQATHLSVCLCLNFLAHITEVGEALAWFVQEAGPFCSRTAVLDQLQHEGSLQQKLSIRPLMVALPFRAMWILCRAPQFVSQTSRGICRGTVGCLNNSSLFANQAACPGLQESGAPVLSEAGDTHNPHSVLQHSHSNLHCCALLHV